MYAINFKSMKRQLIGLVKPLLPKPSVKPCIIHVLYYLRLYTSLWLSHRPDPYKKISMLTVHFKKKGLAHKTTI